MWRCVHALSNAKPVYLYKVYQHISRTGYTNGGFSWLITFRSLIGDIENREVDDKLLLGSNAFVYIEK